MKRKRRRRQWHNQMANPSRGRLAASFVVLAICYGLAVAGVIASRGTSLLLLVVGWLAMVRLCRGNWRRGINTDEDGLIERFVFRRRRELRWDEFTAVEMSDDAATLHHPDGPVHLAPPLGNWALIASMARRHLGLEPELDEAEVPLPPEQVASWLGVEPGGKLTCRSRLGWFMGGLAGLFGLLALACLFSGMAALRGFAFGLLGSMLGWPLGLWAIRRWGATRPEYARVLEAVATGEELRIRTDSGWRTVPWGGLLRTNRSIAGWTFVSSTDGDLMVPVWLTGHKRLLSAIDQAIAARRAGLTLPRLTGDVPEAALSRAEVNVEAGRGLSTAADSPEAPGA